MGYTNITLEKWEFMRFLQRRRPEDLAQQLQTITEKSKAQSKT